MELNLAPNPLYQVAQTLTINKVATLIGGNGSGKSTILRSVFESRLNTKDYLHLRVVCFSSGQNETFSKSFGNYLTRERRAGRALSLECFYFDKSWSKLLIFLATSLKRDGKVRSFLRDNNYIVESAGLIKDDTTTKLSFSFKVDSNYIERVKQALLQEEQGQTDTLRATSYFRSLQSFIENSINADYEFNEPISKRTIEINSQVLFSTSFASDRIDQEDESQTSKIQNDPTLSFFTQAADNDYFIDKNNLSLTFNNNLELDQLSDGEYQLLFIYSLLDLLDTSNTLFLFDEADSHLHYKNVEKLWSILHKIQGFAITTTHLLDSITANHFDSLKVVEKGKINESDKIKQLIQRLSILARAKSVEYEICAKIPHLALMDDYNDWTIFKLLAEKKGLNIEPLSSIQAIKKTSSFSCSSESFGKAKLDWVKELSRVESGNIVTKIFLICDRDELALNDIDNRTGVKVNGKQYQQQINALNWANGINVNVFLLAWKRREIKSYLLSYTALSKEGVIEEINNANLAKSSHLKENNSGDNDDIRRLNAKPTIDNIVNTSGIGFDLTKLKNYINLIPPEEISEDIENMYNFIFGKL